MKPLSFGVISQLLSLLFWNRILQATAPIQVLGFHSTTVTLPCSLSSFHCGRRFTAPDVIFPKSSTACILTQVKTRASTSNSARSPVLRAKTLSARSQTAAENELQEATAEKVVTARNNRISRQRRIRAGCRSWNESYDKLLEFKAKMGHCNVPRRHKEDPKLGNWVAHQRGLAKKGKLDKQRQKKLVEIGFQMTPTGEFQWKKNYEKLLEFRARNGHCNVPQAYKKDPKLGNWVMRQRRLAKKGQLDKQRQQKLDSIGFWETPPGEYQWQKNYGKLLEFKAKNGHCNVPSRYNKDPKLGNWVNTLKQYAKKGKLDKQRQQKLDAIDFNWASTINHVKWTASFDRLLEYRRDNGHCNVPGTYKEDPKLASWVFTQRQFAKKGKLDKQRQQKLNAIGFRWTSTIYDEQ